MRIWSLHPKHLDAKGLVALWRETLLAKHVLEGKTKGYKNHPQLNRFKKLEAPIDAINCYLEIIYNEASSRGYNFNPEKFIAITTEIKITVTRGQLNYEIEHLQAKLRKRDLKKYKENKLAKRFDVNPIFRTVKGEIEDWEIV
jgi:hypothetical protein